MRSPGIVVVPWLISPLEWGAYLLFVAGLLAIGTIWLMIKVLKKAARRDARAAFNRLRERVLGLFERGEALRNRLERFNGEGDPTPRGRTLTELEAVRAELRRLMDRWTEQHARLEEVEALLEHEHPISNAHLERARKLATASIEACDQILPIAARAEAIMDRLEAAPDRALRAISALRCEVGAKLPGNAGTLTLEQITSFEQELKPDPLGVAERAEALLQKRKAS